MYIKDENDIARNRNSHTIINKQLTSNRIDVRS